MKDDSCCLNCKDRKSLCHSNCKKYLEYRKRIDFINKRKREINEQNSVYFRRRRN